MTRAEVDALFAQLPFPGIPPAQFGFHVWHVRYLTRDVHGRPTVASGTMVVPDGAEGELPVVSDQHGTQVQRLPSSAPLLENETVAAGLFLATHGYLVVGAHYLGLGDSPGLHPYLHAESEASASLDMIRAAREISPWIGVTFGRQLFLTGYSQGGHATMALHRELERTGATRREFQVTAAAPMAGAYDLADVSLPNALTSPAPASSLYVAYAMLGLGSAYRFYDDLSEIFVAPYDTQVQTLFDGNHSFEEVMAALPATPGELLQPAIAEGVLQKDPRSRLRRVLQRNEVYNWRPVAPIRLLHSEADADVPFQNAIVARDRMRSLGGDVEVLSLGDTLGHTEAVVPAYLAAKAWFDTLRETVAR